MSEVLLPPNASAQELALEGATARVEDVPTPLRDLWDADACPDALLPWMAWAYSVDNWNANWTPVQQRAAIKAAVAVHRYKGTIGAVRSALAALGFEVHVQEWFKQAPEGAPYTFRLLLDVNQLPLDLDALLRIQDVVNSNKNLRSHLDTVIPSVTTRAGPVVAGVLAYGMDTAIQCPYGDLRLLIEGAENGSAQTEAAVDSVHQTLHETLPQNNYW